MVNSIAKILEARQAYLFEPSSNTILSLSFQTQFSHVFANSFLWSFCNLIVLFYSTGLKHQSKFVLFFGINYPLHHITTEVFLLYYIIWSAAWSAHSGSIAHWLNNGMWWNGIVVGIAPEFNSCSVDYRYLARRWTVADKWKSIRKRGVSQRQEYECAKGRRVVS